MSLNPTKKEIEAVVAILQDPNYYEPDDDGDVPSVQDVAKAIIKAIDVARTHRTTYLGVMVFGPQFSLAVGPYSGATSARNAVMKFPGASVAKRVFVVPLLSAEGVEARLREVG